MKKSEKKNLIISIVAGIVSTLICIGIVYLSLRNKTVNGNNVVGYTMKLLPVFLIENILSFFATLLILNDE